MPITNLPDLTENNNTSLGDELSIVLHGPIKSDITLICHGQRSAKIIEAAEFLTSDGIPTNVIQLSEIDPFPGQQIGRLIRSSYHVLLIEDNVELDIHKLIQDHTEITLTYRQYFNPNQVRLQAHIISLVKKLFVL